jgi:hypothetical protein
MQPLGDYSGQLKPESGKSESSSRGENLLLDKEIAARDRSATVRRHSTV